MGDVIHLERPHSLLLMVLAPVATQGDQVAFQNFVCLVETEIPANMPVSKFAWEQFNQSFFMFDGCEDRLLLAVGYRELNHTPAADSPVPDWEADHPDNVFFVRNTGGHFVCSLSGSPIDPTAEDFNCTDVCSFDPGFFLHSTKPIHHVARFSIENDDGGALEFQFPVYAGQSLVDSGTGDEIAKIQKNNNISLPHAADVFAIHVSAPKTNMPQPEPN